MSQTKEPVAPTNWDAGLEPEEEISVTKRSREWTKPVKNRAASVLLHLDGTFVDQIDSIVADLRMEYKITQGGLSSEIIENAKKIMRAEGLNEANEYLEKNRMPHPSRHNFCLHLVELGLETWKKENKE